MEWAHKSMRNGGAEYSGGLRYSTLLIVTNFVWNAGPLAAELGIAVADIDCIVTIEGARRRRRLTNLPSIGVDLLLLFPPDIDPVALESALSDLRVRC